jgi:hypothetical protein
MVLWPKYYSIGHTIILGRPWLATADAFVCCKYRNMFISHGDLVKQVTLNPPEKYLTKLKNIMWYDNVDSDEKFVHPVFTIDQVMNFKGDAEEYQINTFLYDSNFT